MDSNFNELVFCVEVTECKDY